MSWNVFVQIKDIFYFQKFPELTFLKKIYNCVLESFSNFLQIDIAVYLIKARFAQLYNSWRMSRNDKTIFKKNLISIAFRQIKWWNFSLRNICSHNRTSDMKSFSEMWISFEIDQIWFFLENVIINLRIIVSFWAKSAIVLYIRD